MRVRGIRPSFSGTIRQERLTILSRTAYSWVCFQKPHTLRSRLPFKVGDWGLLYTDGILEMNNSSEEEFGVDRFKEFLQDNYGLSAGKFVDALLDRLSQWSELASGREPEDDVTLLAFHFEDPTGLAASKP